MECILCYTIKNKLIECPKCKESACISCYKQYLLTLYNEPTCFKCDAIWDREFLTMNLPKHFMNTEYKKHREDVLKDREISLLPETQCVIEYINNLNSQINSHIIKKSLIREETSKQIAIVNDKYHQVLKSISANRMKEIKEIRDESNSKLDAINSIIADNETKLNDISHIKDDISRDYIVVKNCPLNDCRGFLTKKYRCGMCNISVCEKCLDVKHENHTCNVDNIKSAQYIQQTSRSCPNCGIYITKIDGCNQMWCTHCKKGFDWKTGYEISNATIHNPHYEHYVTNIQTDNEKNDYSVKCGELPDIELFSGLQCSKDTKDLLYSIHSRVRYIRENYLKNYDTEDNQIRCLFFDLRVKYLKKEIDEMSWKKKLQQIEKDYTKKKELYMVNEMLFNVSCDIFHQLLLQEDHNIDQCYEIITQFEKLRLYYNKQISTIKYNYGCNTYLLSDKWKLDANY